MIFPNLIIAGHPRSGTSSLHSYLGQHPEIFMTPIKEPNFFASDFHIESDQFHKKQLYFPFRTRSKYLELYKNVRRAKIAGEASWTNFYSMVAAKNIHMFNSRAKILIIFREPIDFLYSYHSAATFALGETILNFRDAICAERERKYGYNLSKRVIVPSWLFYTQFVNYYSQIKRYLSIFDRDLIKILIFDDLKTDTGRVYRDILDFLEVNSGFIPQFTIVNPNKTLKWPKVKKLVLDSPYFRNFIRRILTHDGYAAMKGFYKNKWVTYSPRPNIDEDTRVELMKKFKTEVTKTGDLVDQDLIRLWGYDKI